MLTGSVLTDILSHIEYQKWEYSFRSVDGGWLIWFSFIGTERDQSITTRFSTRKWYVSQHASNSEVVQTVLKAILTAEEHEARERFRYRGVALFAPHFNVDEWAEMHPASRPSEDLRREHG